MLLLLLIPSSLADPWQERWDRAWRVGQHGPVGTPWLDGDRPSLDTEDPMLAPRLAAWEAPLSGQIGVRAAWSELPQTVALGLQDRGFTARAFTRVGARVGLFEAFFRPTAGVVDIGNPRSGRADVRAHTWWVGARHRAVYVGLGAVPLPTGPARQGPLLWSRHAAPPPGLGAGLRGHVLGSPHLAYTVDVHGGQLPGARSDVTNPGWLLLDARTTVTPFAEIGITRTSLFGGRDEAGPLPVAPLQVILPTKPHVEGDADRSEPDTDEIASWDVRLRVPVTASVAAQAFVQHGGEDLVVGNLGPLRWPRLAGVANAYGATVDVRDVWVAGEWAVVQDDRFRWYEAHRVYHEGWRHLGDYLGHPRGGDQRTIYLESGVDLREERIGLSFERVRRSEILDVVGNTVFALPQDEVRNEGRATATWLATRGWWTLEVGLAHVAHPDFDVEGSRIESEIGVAFTTHPATTDRSAPRPSRRTRTSP